MNELCTFALFALFASAAAAQAPLGTDQAGPCYATCMARMAEGNRERESLFYQLVTMAEIKGSDPVGAAAAARLRTCGALQETLLEADACAAGCRDLAGARTGSEAEAIFTHSVSHTKSIATAVGLYFDYRNYPQPGTAEFRYACDRLLSPEPAPAEGEEPEPLTPFNLP